MVFEAQDRDLSQAFPNAADGVRDGGSPGSPARLPAETRSGPPAAHGGEDKRLPGPGRARAGPIAAPPAPLTDAATAFLQAIRIHFVHFAGFVLEEIRSRRWASVTFQGARHELSFHLEGDGAEAAAARFLGGLGPRNFALRGHLVADVSLVEEERRPGFARIRLEALTVEEK